MKQTLSILKALGDETRVRLLYALRGGELCVCQLVELAGLAPSTVSKHLSILTQAGLAESRKDGRWMHYRLTPARKVPMIGKIRDAVFQSLETSGAVAADAAHLQKIKRSVLEALCKKQRTG